jgi:hypothetical protein
MPSQSAWNLQRVVARIHPRHGLAIGGHEAIEGVPARLQRRRAGDEQADGLAPECVGVVAGGDDADLFLVELVEAERRRRPADVDLAGHDLRQRRGRAAGRDRLGLEAVLLDEGRHDAVRRRAVGRIGDGLSGGVLEGCDGRIGAYIPEQVGAARGFRTQNAHRRARLISRTLGKQSCAVVPAVTLCRKAQT